MIPIKQLTQEDEQAFQEFLKTERRELPGLHIAPLPFPHEAVAVFHRLNTGGLAGLAEACGMGVTEVDGETVVLSHHAVMENCAEKYAFSGYVLREGKLTFGAEELVQSGLCPDDLEGCYGEFNLLRIGKGRIELSADFFGMSPWYYYSDGEVFAASNHYHFLLEALKQCGVRLSMNIRRSRVNIITSGYTYGSNFTPEMDITNCYLSLPYEKIVYGGTVSKEKTELYRILTTQEYWDEDTYEEYLQKAKHEIYDNTLAYFSSDRFKQIVIDVSGGFDSRIVFATANNLPRRLRKKIATHTRRSGTRDDVEKAAGVTNVYGYKRVRYQDNDDSDLIIGNEVNLSQVSRNLGSFCVNTTLYLNRYDSRDRLQMTGGIGDAVFGYKRIRGELNYSLGDKRLLARLGGCYLWNSVEQLKGVFSDQEDIILESLDGYNCSDLFQKFHVLYVNYRNRLNFGNAHNIEYDNLRVSPLHSKYALKAKWMYFRRFDNNRIPDEKISVDLLTMINPLLATIPFADNNDDVLPSKENLLWQINAEVKPDFESKSSELLAEKIAPEKLYRTKVVEYMSDLSVAEQMLLQIYDYSHEYEPVCLGLYRVLREFREKPDDLRSGHGMEQIRKIYDVYYQMKMCATD